MGEQFFLTENGNILASNGEKHCFCTPSMQLHREVANDEFNHLMNCNLLQFHPIGTYNVPPLSNLPVWHKLISILVVDDDTDYKWQTCNNGGNYGYSTHVNVYCTKYPNGEWKFACLNIHETTAEFGFDQLSGHFQSDCKWLTLCNVEGQPSFYTWLHEDTEDVLEKYAISISFEEILKLQYVYYPSRDEENIDPQYSPAVKYADIKSILSKFKELGIDRKKLSKPVFKRR
jgi:hypothetical protein